MRILFTALPAAGHIRPLVPIAHAAMLAGHDVMLCTPTSAKAQVEAYGLAHLPGGIDWLATELAALDRLAAPAGDEQVGRLEAIRQRFNKDLTTEGLAGPAPLALARDVLAAADFWRPDLVVRDNSEFGGYLAAEVLGVPHASVAVGGGKAHELAAMLAAPLDEHRRSLGLPTDPAGARIHAHLHVSLAPPQYHELARTVPRTRYYRQTSPLEPTDRLPDWIADWLAVPAPGGRPAVFAAFGTLLPGFTAFREPLDASVEGLGEVDCAAVIATGCCPVPSGTLPANVRLVDRVPQPLVLECSDLFVTHGGFNSVREALRLGVPMVVVPWLVDTRRNAARCAELGVAEVVPIDALSPARLRDACATVLGDPSYRRQAGAIQRAMLALPGMDTLVADLCSLSR